MLDHRDLARLHCLKVPPAVLTDQGVYLASIALQAGSSGGVYLALRVVVAYGRARQPLRGATRAERIIATTGQGFQLWNPVAASHQGVHPFERYQSWSVL